MTDTAYAFNFPIWLFIPLFFSLTLLTFFRAKAYLMFFQQEEYDGPRFLNWLRHKRFFDRRFTIWALVAIAGHIVLIDLLKGELGGTLYILVPLFLIVGSFHAIWLSNETLSKSKKPLAMTQRAKRIFGVTLIIGVGLLLLVFAISGQLATTDHYYIEWGNSFLPSLGYVERDYRLVGMILLSILHIQGIPGLLTLANKLLEPFEERVKAKFRQEAIEKLQGLNPTIIAVTGSFGKTSVKHVLAHILDTAAPTLMTPGSVNTEMGITRIIREKLTPEHQYFIVEMGAYGPGSIARLCRLTPPHHGIITALGPAHYERFTSLETVARAKFELAEAVVHTGGNILLNCDAMDAGLRQEREAAIPGQYIHLGKGMDWTIVKITQNQEGLTILLKGPGDEEHQLAAPIFGDHQAGNIALAAITARKIGLPWAVIKGALATLYQIRHRLEVTRTPEGVTILDDAYNANPTGFASALRTLSDLVKPGGRRILITPGMVELGETHDSAHAEIGRLAAHHVDIALLVTPERMASFEEAIKDEGRDAVQVLTFNDQESAEAWARGQWRAGDIVLFENNLPDLYEKQPSF